MSGKLSAGNPHAAFEVAGAGNVTKGVGLRTVEKAAENPPTLRKARQFSTLLAYGRHESGTPQKNHSFST